MAKKKLTTEEILAAARGQDADADGAAKASEEKESGAGSVSETKPESAAAAPKADKPKPAGGAPKSTADILAAARAEAGGAKKPAAAKKPASTADILAAARAEKGGGAAGGEKPAKAAAAKKAAPAELPPGEKPSVQEMLKAVREGKPLGEKGQPAGEASSKPSLPPMPTRPVVKPAAKAKGDVSRRGVLGAMFLTPFALAWQAFAATSALSVLAFARFMFPNVLVEPPMKFKVGPPSDYPFGTVSEKWKPGRGVWLVHTDRYEGRNLIVALASVCTHLGCTPNWLESEQKFKCPCHGSGFYIDGINFEGPAPRPLERVGLRVAEDGMLEVDKSVKFQEELGQWMDPASYVEVV